MAKDLIENLNDLIHLDVDAVSAYRQAIDACAIPEIKNKLTEFQGDHERHIQDLSKVVVAAGGTPEAKADVKGFFIEGFTAITSRGDHSALLAMRGNEELTTRTYKAALGETLTPEARTVIERNFADEQRHLAWIKQALDSKLYEAKRAA
jgi:uncharacterized protein (TIGR02284 family)